MSQQTCFDFDEPSTTLESCARAGALARAPSAPDAPDASGSSGAAPLEYELRVSRRARRLSLRVLHGRGLVVTIPQRYPRRDVAAVVESHREWALQALADLDARTPDIYRQWPPQRLELAAMGIRVLVVFDRNADASEAPLETSIDKEQVLVLTCDAGDRPAVASEIARWLKPLAKEHLSALVRRFADQHGLSFRRITIRGQRSLWGSCSSTGTLSLNYKLLFLRPELVEYVVLHELAHTRHMDHSPAFWASLEAMLPKARVIDAKLNDAGQRVPPWLELAR